MAATVGPLLRSGIAVAGAAAITLPLAISPPHSGAADLLAVQLTTVTGSAIDLLDEAIATAFARQLDVLTTVADAATGNFLAPLAYAIQGLYDSVEPVVAYGFDLAEWAVGWVPFIGLLAPQIDIFYHLGEPIVESLVFNTTDILAGLVGFGAGLSDIGTDIAAAFQTFIQAEIDWVLSFLPPLPPIGLSTAGLDLAALAPLMLLAPGTDLGMGALSSVADALSGGLADLLLSLIG